MRLVVAANARTPFAGVLREHFERILQHPDPLLYHDDLAEVNTPVYLHEFVAHAARHGLQFLAEARLHDSQLHELPEDVAAELGRLPDDAVLREQYIDFVVNRMFRQTLLCRDDVALDRTLDARRLAGLSFAAPLGIERTVGEQPTFVGRRGVSFQPGRPQLSAAIEAIAAAWPKAVTFEQLTADLDPSARDRLGTELLEIHAAGVLDLHTHPPAPAAVPGVPSRRVAARAAPGRGGPRPRHLVAPRLRPARGPARRAPALAARRLARPRRPRGRDPRVRRGRRPRRDRRRAAGRPGRRARRRPRAPRAS